MRNRLGLVFPRGLGCRGGFRLTPYVGRGYHRPDIRNAKAHLLPPDDGLTTGKGCARSVVS